jgi:hypothetical protein
MEGTMDRFEGKLGIHEARAINAFTEERMMAIYSLIPRSWFDIDQEEHIKAVIFNAITDAYMDGLKKKTRKNSPKFKSKLSRRKCPICHKVGVLNFNHVDVCPDCSKPVPKPKQRTKKNGAIILEVVYN